MGGSNQNLPSVGVAMAVRAANDIPNFGQHFGGHVKNPPGEAFILRVFAAVTLHVGTELHAAAYDDSTHPIATVCRETIGEAQIAAQRQDDLHMIPVDDDSLARAFPRPKTAFCAVVGEEKSEITDGVT